MTDPTPGSGLPGEPVDPADARFGPETPGPEATPEQASYVTALLGSLRADDPAVPDHVAARLDGALAELRRTEPLQPSALGEARALGDGDASDATADPTVAAPTTTAATDATVLPMPTPRRESGTTRTFRWVAGAAAAVIVLGAGAAVIRTGVPGAGSSTTALSADDSTSGGAEAGADGAAVAIRTSGTDYRSSELASQAQSLVANAAKGLDPAPELAPDGTPATGATSSGVAAPGARSLLTSATLAACLEQLTGAPGARPVAVDQGTFEGKPADVVVLPSPDDPQRLEVWVIGPGCTRESAELYEFRTILAPGAGSAPDATPGATSSP